MNWFSKLCRSVSGPGQTQSRSADTIPSSKRTREAAKTPVGWKNRVSEAEVARILDAVAAPPNLRPHPLPGDLSGRFDKWFDGGAIRTDTGSQTYQFFDGTTALVGTMLTWLSLTIRFPDGKVVRIRQQTE